MKKRTYRPAPSAKAKQKPRIDWSNLKKVGFWYSGGYIPSFHHPRNEHYPHAQDHVGEWDPDELKIVVEYLQNPIDFTQHRRSSLCRFCRVRVGSQDYTDGVYVWPQRLEHYLLEHSVRLPEEFIQHVLLKRHPRIGKEMTTAQYITVDMVANRMLDLTAPPDPQLNESELEDGVLVLVNFQLEPEQNGVFKWDGKLFIRHEHQSALVQVGLDTDMYYARTWWVRLEKDAFYTRCEKAVFVRCVIRNIIDDAENSDVAINRITEFIGPPLNL